jgi:hypothetical protein
LTKDSEVVVGLMIDVTPALSTIKSTCRAALGRFGLINFTISTGSHKCQKKHETWFESWINVEYSISASFPALSIFCSNQCAAEAKLNRKVSVQPRSLPIFNSIAPANYTEKHPPHFAKAFITTKPTRKKDAAQEQVCCMKMPSNAFAK